MSKQEFTKGDKVIWQSPGSMAEGKVEEKNHLRHHCGQTDCAGI
jgi:hypothetical protein